MKVVDGIKYFPTAELRFVLRQHSESVPGSVRAEIRQLRILQQKWCATTPGDDHMWLDVPIVEAE